MAWGVNQSFFFFAYGYPIIPAPFVEKNHFCTNLPLWFVECRLTLDMWLTFWTSSSILLIYLSDCALFLFWNLMVFFKKYLFIYLTALDLSCSIWDLVPWPGIEPRIPALGALSLRLWTTMEILGPIDFFVCLFCLVQQKNRRLLKRGQQKKKKISTQTIGQIILGDQLIITGEIFVNTDWCLVLLGVALK